MFTIIYFQPIKTLNKNYIIYPLFVYAEIIF